MVWNCEKFVAAILRGKFWGFESPNYFSSPSQLWENQIQSIVFFHQANLDETHKITDKVNTSNIFHYLCFTEDSCHSLLECGTQDKGKRAFPVVWESKIYTIIFEITDYIVLARYFVRFLCPTGSKVIKHNKYLQRADTKLE